MKLTSRKFIVNFRLTPEEWEASEQLRLALNMGRSTFWRFLLKNMRSKMGKVVMDPKLNRRDDGT